MHKGRVEAFSDGVIAIIITIMVLELKAPQGTDLASLRPSAPTFLGFVLSFAHVGIYWSNHHHLFQMVRRVNGAVLLANLHLLFWLSLIPFATNWLGATNFSRTPAVIYGALLLVSAIAYSILAQVLVRVDGRDSSLAAALGRDRKVKVSLTIYAASLATAFVFPWLACGGYALVALIWLIPDTRIERRIRPPGESDQPAGTVPS